MRYLFFLLVCLACSPAQRDTPDASRLTAILSAGKWLDLSYAFSDTTLYWPNNKTGFQLDTMFNGVTEGGYFYSSYGFCAPEHGGTHLDAPIHFAAGRWTSDQIPPDRFQGAAVVVDISEKSLPNRDYLVATSDFTEWEKAHGKIPEQAIVLLRTGYGKFYPDRASYFGTAARGAEAVAQLHFPGLDPVAAEWLVQNRKVKAVGLDTPSIDYGQSKDFKAHQVLLGANILVFENVAHLDRLPITGSYVFALPMKIQNGSGGPLRIMAWVGQ